MKTFLKSHNLQNLRKKLSLTYLFMVLDIILTIFLLDTGYAFEANPLMKSVVTSPFYSFLIKILLPALLLLYLSIRMKSATDRQLKISNYFINTLNLFYLIVVSSQIIYCILLLFIAFFL